MTLPIGIGMLIWSGISFVLAVIASRDDRTDSLAWTCNIAGVVLMMGGFALVVA